MHSVIPATIFIILYRYMIKTITLGDTMVGGQVGRYSTE